MEEYEGDDGGIRGNKYGRVETKENWAEVDTSSGSEYMPEGNGSGNSSGTVIRYGTWIF